KFWSCRSCIDAVVSRPEEPRSMTTQAKTFNARSWLFAPGDSGRKMEKATAGAADVVILDLEDSVTEAEKPKVRSMVAAFLKANRQHRSRLWIRMNPIQGPHALADLATVMPAAPAGVIFPKPRGRADA